MKKTLCMLLSLLFLFSLAACGESEVTAKKSFDEIYADISAAAELPEMLALDGNTLYIYVGIGNNLYTQNIAAIPLSATSGDMLFVFEATDEANASVIKGLLENFLAQKTSEMKDYIPAEYDKLIAASVTLKAQYVWLVVSSDSDKILDVINDNIK